MTKKFSIVIKNETFTSNEEGFLDLNDISVRLQIPDTKKPNQWRTKYRKSHMTRGDIKSISEGSLKTTLANSLATISYAMFVSDDFYFTVVSAFNALREGNVEEAFNLAMETTPEQEQDAIVLKVINTQKWFNREQAFKMSGIFHPRLFFRALINTPEFFYECENRGLIEYKPINHHVDRVWRCSNQGFKWFAKHHKTINLWVEEYKLSSRGCRIGRSKYLHQLLEALEEEVLEI